MSRSTRVTVLSFLTLTLTLALPAGCPAPQGNTGETTGPRAQPPARATPADPPPTKRTTSTPAARPSRPAVQWQPSCKSPQPVPASGYLAASHILIFYQGGMRAPAHIQRSKADAAKLATRITALARRPGASFAKLAGQWSEGPTRSRGGRLGRFAPGRMVPPFSAAVKATCIGDVIGPVETRFGFHVILREQP